MAGKTMETLAYAIETAYRTTTSQDEALKQVKEKHPSADTYILTGMWEAIDAYVDINT